MRRHSILPVLAVILALIGVSFGVYFVSRLPRTLTMAVGPVGLETHRYAEALAQAGTEARDRIRLRIVTTEGAEASARLMETGKVDLAIIRSDYDLPTNGQSILVNTRRIVVVMAPQRARGGIRKFDDLKGKRIAVVKVTDPNLPLVRHMLAVADIGEKDATLVEAEMQDLPELLGTGKMDAAIAIVVPSAPSFTALVPEIAKRLPGGLRIVPLDEAQAIANRVNGVEIAEIPAGAFGAKRPVEEVATVAITYRTVARATMSEDLAGNVAKSLYDLRTRLNRTIPIAFTAEPPDGKAGARLPVHPGAMAYFDGESKTFYERYGEMLFTGLWGASILGSGLFAIVAWASRKRRGEGSKLVDEIVTLTTAARSAAPEQLRTIEVQGDAIVASLAQLRKEGDISEALIESAALALDHFRSVVESVRR
jgi:TRAP transporter TAXI family solute receptor